MNSNRGGLDPPHSADFTAVWRVLVTEVFNWRTEGEFVRVPSLFGPATLSYLPLLNYTDLTPEQASALRDSVSERPHLIRVLTADSGELQPQAPVTMRLDLARRSSEQVFQQSLHSKCRNQVRKAKKSPITTRSGHEPGLIRDFYGLLSQTHHRHGMPMPPRALFEAFPRRFETTYYVVYHQEQPIAGLVALRDRSLVWVPWAASERDFLKFCPNHQAYWRAICDALEQGAQVFDFGRSPYRGNTYRFKAQWGAEPVAISLLAPGRADAYQRFRLAQRLWRSVPRSLVDVVGPRLCRYLADF